MHALIIEDDALTAFMLKDWLADLGYESVDMASSEDCAIALAAAHRPDLVTADIRLEQGTGAAAVAAITRSCALPVIFITGNPEVVGKRLDHPPGTTVIRKPVSERELRAAIEKVLGRALPEKADRAADAPEQVSRSA